MKLSLGMSKAAWDHSKYQVDKNFMGHNGPKGKEGPGNRINLYGKWGLTCGENIGGSLNNNVAASAVHYIIGLMIDDGVPSRGHRANLFSEDFKYMGVGLHKKSENERERCTITYAGGYSEDTGKIKDGDKKLIGWNEKCDKYV